MLGPLLISFILCFVIFDYSIYVETNSSPLSWLWSTIAYIFNKLRISYYLAFTNLFWFGAIVVLGICLVVLSLREATKAMRATIKDAVIIPTNKITQTNEQKPLGKIFISYRRGDSDGDAQLLHERLNKRFPGRVFMDVSAINPGADFVRAVEDIVGSCDVLLAIIGKTGVSANGIDPRRLEDPNDLMCLEIASALNRDTKVVPVLLQDSRMPAETELPENISALARCQPVVLSDDDLVRDVERLSALLAAELGDNKQAAIEPIIKLLKRYWPIGAAAVLATLLIFLSEWGILRF
jgi:hypothetical protein